MNKSRDVNTKEALLAAAIEVFADKGFDSATVRAICSKAKANVAAVNYHFGSKNGLYAAVLEEVFPSGEEWFAPTDPSRPAEERLHGFLRGLASEIYERRAGQIAQRWAIFLREIAKPSDNLGFIVQHQIQPRADELRNIVAAILGPDVPEATLAFCSSNIWALMMDHLLTQPFLDRLTPLRPSMEDNLDAYVDHVTKFALGGLNAIKQQH